MNAKNQVSRNAPKKGRKLSSKPKRIPRMANQIHLFSAFTSLPGGVGSLANTVSVQESFWEIAPKFSDLPGYTNYTALFDKFRLTKIEVELIPTAQLIGNIGGSATTSRGCYLLTIVDHDDATAPASLNEMRQYSNCKLHTQGVVKRTFQPSVLTMAYETNIATAYSPKFGTWLSTTDSGTTHFGLKIGMYVIDVTQVTNSIIFMVGAKYWFECKDFK